MALGQPKENRTNIFLHMYFLSFATNIFVLRSYGSPDVPLDVHLLVYFKYK